VRQPAARVRRLDVHLLHRHLIGAANASDRRPIHKITRQVGNGVSFGFETPARRTSERGSVRDVDTTYVGARLGSSSGYQVRKLSESQGMMLDSAWPTAFSWTTHRAGVVVVSKVQRR
jgi:hypothetical protein